jgi:hypothetical protein
LNRQIKVIHNKNKEGRKCYPVKKIAITHPGVNNGLHAGTSCCVNLVYLGLLDSFKTDTGPPVSDVLAPFIFPLSELKTVLCCLFDS